MTSAKITPTLEKERAFWQSGISRIAGLDEAGRGAWAGPVYAGAVILPSTFTIKLLMKRLSGVRDSKCLNPQQREFWAEQITKFALAYSTGSASRDEIDQLGIVAATRLAMQRAMLALNPQPQLLLIDALKLPGLETPQVSYIRGDAHILSIACASILAKVARDAWMRNLDKAYPGYGFAKHKGYGTAMHQHSLARLGPAPCHRASFAPIKALLNEACALSKMTEPTNGN